MKNIGIYIHIPFCKKKCKYCDFLSFENCSFEKEYIDRVLWDIDNIERLFEENKIGRISNSVQVDTIYFGGGTPSFIDSKYILQILREIRRKFDVKNNAEITIEVNPGTVNFDKLTDYFNSGINRISIGCQEIHNNILKTIGRIHSFEDFLNAYNLIKNIGFRNINVDLMLGLPNQTLLDLEETLNKIIELEPNHISLYSLILEEGTPLEKEVLSKKLSLPTEDLERKMYHKTKGILEENGYIHYEISNFAKKDFYSKHSWNCWKQCEYIGFGLGSHSYFNKKRFSNETNFQKYIEKNCEQVYNKSVAIHENQTIQDEMKEYIMLGFRKLSGINKKEFYQKFGKSLNLVFHNEISQLNSEGLIEDDDESLKLSLKGLDLANLVFEKFI